MQIALYRKYRPDNFENIIGQEQVISVLKKQIEEDKISHAYVFSGTRGTGKTSTAKVFAKSLNCKNYDEQKTICNVCDSCKNIDVDVIEIDAASNNNVDNIRSLIDTIMYRPSFGRYKIYIIDEAHMLTNGAFNALLKTLEEPPSHIIFILATTELQKIPSTILSRCQKFEFTKVSTQDIKNRLQYILEQENIPYEDEAIIHIANMSDGGLRDAISTLDQVSSYGSVNMGNIDFVTGLSSIKLIDEYIKYMLEKNIPSIINISQDIIKKSDIKKIPSQIIQRLLDIIHIQNDVNQDILDKQSLEDIINSHKNVDVSDVILQLSQVESDMKYSANPDILFLSFSVKVCKDIQKNNDVINNLIKKIDYLEEKIKKLEQVGISVTVAEKTQDLQEKEDIQITKKAEYVDITDDISQEEKEKIEFVNSLLKDVQSKLKDMKSANIGAFLYEGSIRRYVENTIYISFKKEHSFHKTKLEEKNNLDILKTAFSDILSKKIDIKVVFDIEKIDIVQETKNVESALREIFADVNIKIIE